MFYNVNELLKAFKQMVLLRQPTATWSSLSLCFCSIETFSLFQAAGRPTYLSHHLLCSQETCPSGLSLKINSLTLLSCEGELLPVDRLTTTWVIRGLLQVKSLSSQMNLLFRLLLCTWNFHKSSAKPPPFTLARLPTIHVPSKLETSFAFFPESSTKLWTTTAT